MNAIFSRYTSSKNTAILMLKPKFQLNAVPVYVPASDVPNMKKGDTVDIPEGFTLVDFVTRVQETDEKGEPVEGKYKEITVITADGVVCKTLRYA